MTIVSGTSVGLMPAERAIGTVPCDERIDDELYVDRFPQPRPSAHRQRERSQPLLDDGDVVVPAAVTASPAQPVPTLADHGVRLRATARW